MCFFRNSLNHDSTGNSIFCLIDFGLFYTCKCVFSVDVVIQQNLENKFRAQIVRNTHLFEINLELNGFREYSLCMNYFNICLQKYMIWVCEETSH